MMNDTGENKGKRNNGRIVKEISVNKGDSDEDEQYVLNVVEEGCTKGVFKEINM